MNWVAQVDGSKSENAMKNYRHSPGNEEFLEQHLQISHRFGSNIFRSELE